MNNILFAGLLAGLVSAILLVAGAQGGILALLPALTAPLPIVIVSIGWSAFSGGLASLIAAFTFGIYFSAFGSFLPLFLAAFFLYFAPAAWFGYQILLAREDEQGQLEWYPVGQLLAWVALLGSLAGLSPLIPYGFNYEAFQEDFGALFRTAFSESFADMTTTDQDLEAMAAVSARMAPAFLGVYWIIIMLVNLYLGSLIVRISGRLKRPWPSFIDTRLPIWAAYVFGGSLVVSFFSGFIGLAGIVFGLAFALALTLQGLVLFHFISRGHPLKVPLLVLVYVSLFMFSFFHVLAGLFDTSTNIRERFRNNRPNRPPHS